MGYQRSRQTPTVATTLDTVPSSNGASSRAPRTGDNNPDKENANLPTRDKSGSSKHRYPSRSRTTAVQDRPILKENGGSRSESRKNPTRGKRVRCPTSNPREDAAARKRSRCVQIRDGCVENHGVKMADSVAVHCNGQDNGRSNEGSKSYRLHCGDAEGAFALNDAHDDRVAGFSNAETSSREGPVEDQSSACVISKMQEMYSKLQLKYKRLKELKCAEVEKYIEEQDRNLTAYVQAQEELLEHLRTENNLLKLHADQQNITMTLNRLKLLEQESIQWQNDLLDQNTKNKELKNEVRRLESLLSEQVDARNKIQNIPAVCQSCEAHCLDIERHVSKSQDIHSENQGDTLVPYNAGLESNLKHQFSAVQKERLQYSCRASGHNTRVDIGNQERKLVCGKTIEATDKNIQPDMKVGLVKSSNFGHQIQKDASEGEKTNLAVGTVNSLVKVLLQSMVGFKITVADEGESPKLVFLHQSSGYSFQLKWLKCANYDSYQSEDGELAYQVISFGTLHKVTPDWMKEEIIFNIAQVDVFFDRLLHVVNGRVYYFGLRR